MHGELKNTDSYFNSVPISDSNESGSLRIAHAQRVISGCLSDIIWQPFSSEQTQQHPELMALLDAISAEVANYHHGSTSGGRAETVWGVLTTRGLRSLKTTSTPERPNRAEKVAAEVLRILKPLITPEKESDLQSELVKLAQSAISIWDSAQSGDLRVQVCPALDPADFKEWRSKLDDERTTDITSTTHPRIFTLFPRITAKQFQLTTKLANSLPGGWPESERDSWSTCIHPGIGLRECSALVIRGKQEVEEKRLEEEEEQRQLNEAIERVKRDYRRSGSHSSRSGSVVGLGSPSLSAQWSKISSRKLVDE